MYKKTTEIGKSKKLYLFTFVVISMLTIPQAKR